MLPSPRTSDTNGAGHHGDGGMDLRTAVAEIGGLCDGCNVREPWEHRCHGEPCPCPECREERRIFGEVTTLLPTPAVNDMGAAYTPETWDEWTATMKAKHNNGNGHGKSLNVEAQRMRVWVDAEDPDAPPGDGYRTTGALLPTPRATDGTKGGPNQRGSSGDLMLPSAVQSLLPTPSVADSTGGHERRGGERGEELLLKGVARAVSEGALLPTPTAADHKASGASGYDSGHDGTTLTDATVRQPDKWGEYEPAIRRWEHILGRPAPEPTKLNAKGNPKLSDEFDEWLMGLPAGWITDVPGVTWNETLKACGNGVVPQQAEAALRVLLDLEPRAAAVNETPLLGTPTARDGKGSGQGERLAESARRGQVEAQVRLMGGTS